MIIKTVTSLMEDLDALGPTVQQVVASLFDRDVRGRVNESISCPVANYLKARGYLFVSVGAGEAMVEFGIADSNWRAMTTELPGAVDEFVGRFDSGEFPELEET